MQRKSVSQIELKSVSKLHVFTPHEQVTKDLENPDESTDGSEGDQFFTYKLLKQICYVALMICLGLVANIAGPTLRDLKDRVGVNYEEISRSVVGLSIGMLGGCLLGGILHERFPKHRDLILSLDWLLQGLAIAVVPWVGHLELVALLFVIVGVSKGIIDTGINTAVLQMWGEQAAAPMHSLHFGFGIGALVVPQLARPFLSPDDENTTTSLHGLFTMVNTENEESRIEIPYIITGAITMFFALMLLGIHIWGTPREFPYQQSVPVSCSLCSPISCAPDGNGTRVILILTTLLLFILNLVGLELAFGLFLFSYAVEKDNPLSTSDATILNTVYWGSFTGGRGFGVFISRIISTDAMIIIHISGLRVSSLALVLSGGNNTVLWIFSGGVGLFVSVLFPCGMSWAHQHLVINSVAIMVILFGSGCGGLIWQYSTGYMFETQGPPSLMYFMSGISIVLVVTYVVMRLVAYKMRPKEDTNGQNDMNKF